MNEIKITAIQGYAGTSKTTTLSIIISKVPEQFSFIGLSYTHHAVKNLLNKVKEIKPFIDSKRFKTIHSYYRIDFTNDFFMGSAKDVDYIFIDEYSMIDKELFKRIIEDAKRHKVKEIYLSGDFLQLPRVGTLKNHIDIDTLRKINGMTINENMIIPLQHFDNTCLTLVDKIVQKTKQYRNQNNKYLQYFIEGSFNNHLDELPFISFEECLKLLQQDYVLIASKYKILESFKNELFLEYKKGDFVYGTETFDDVINGNIYVIMNIENDIVLGRDIESDELIFFKKPYKFYPICLYTFHKSQGLTFKNVIVCIDDLFEFPMLYTGISRSSNDIKFFSTKDKSIRNEYLKKHSGQNEIIILNELFSKIMKN